MLSGAVKLVSKMLAKNAYTPCIRQYEALQVCYASGEFDNEGIKGYLPEKRRRITFGEGATRLHLEE